MNDPRIPELLDFWLGTPARDDAALQAKIERWYQGSDALDHEIRTRFGDTIRRALAGELDGWLQQPRGRLALVIVLDQLARNIGRGTPQAYAGDARALELALAATHEEPELEARLFMLMPLVHAEDRVLHAEAVARSAAMVAAAPEGTRATWAYGHARTLHYRSVIERFGRFPARNEILGRASTAEELAWLAEQDTPLAASA